ncbi:MAG: polymerase subunit delta [Solirubrobacteraceae bacterium]|jgi:DNA polymerase-3 subunit delta|nr:polymerase subunit delta [Solirubrobacteraceae bacterium]
MALKPAYLVHGDDHGRVAERRARLRALAEATSGAEGLEVLEGDAATPENAAAALSAMTLATGHRFVVVDGAERWKDSEELDALEAVLNAMPPDTTVAFFAREDGRAKAPQRLHDAVTKAGGDVAAETTVKPWELPKWVAARARELGLEPDAGAAKALIARVGERQQRLVRELEKLALSLGPGHALATEDLDELASASAERRSWTLADALVARDGPAATRVYLELRAQGERLTGLLFQMARRVREALEVAEKLEAGESPAQVRKRLRMPPKAAERFVADVQRTDRDALRGALEHLADLELDSRQQREGPQDTAALRTILRISTAR